MQRKALHYWLVAIYLAVPMVAGASCGDIDYSTLTEVLNHNPRNYHIFTCRIIQNHIRNSSYESVAVVSYRYHGQPRDTIYLITGGLSTAGGEKLFPGAEWLIVSTTKDDLHYQATVCEVLSLPIKNPDSVNCRERSTVNGKAQLEVLKQYAALRDQSFTGSKQLYGNGQLLAEGYFTDGQPDGLWTHYSYPTSDVSLRIKRIERSYKNGLLDGPYRLYHESEDQQAAYEEGAYQVGRLLWLEKEEYREERQYHERGKVAIRQLWKDSVGTTERQINAVKLEAVHPNHRTVSYHHGPYLNRLSDSRYTPPAKGQYYHGAKVGTWVFYDEQDKIKNSATYPHPPKDTSRLVIYEQDGTPSVVGHYTSGRRTGKW